MTCKNNNKKRSKSTAFQPEKTSLKDLEATIFFFFFVQKKARKEISGGHAYLAMFLKELSMVIQKKMQERKFDGLFF